MARAITPAQHCAIVSRSAAAHSGRANMFAKLGETQAAAVKRLAAATKRKPAETRDYPVFKPGMSTKEYVRAFEVLNSCRSLKPGFYDLSGLNCEPAALYAGGMLDYAPDCEELADGAPVFAEPAPAAADPAEHAPADAPEPEPAAPVDAAEPADIGAALLAMARRLTAKPGRADPAAAASAPAAPIEAPAAPDPAPAPAAPAAAAPRQPVPMLPLFARIALERLQCSADLRSPAQLAELLRAYAGTYGTRCDDETAGAALAQCAARWPVEFGPAGADPAPAAPAAPAEVNPADLAEVKAAAGADDAAAPAGCTPYPGILNQNSAAPDPAGALPAPGGICGLILHNVMVPIVNAAAGGPLDPAAILAAAEKSEKGGRSVLADCIGLPTEQHARQTLADCLEVARRLRAMVPPEPMAAAPATPYPENQNPAPAAPILAHDRPMATAGLTSYRARGRYGWIMIGAADDADAMREARRSCDDPRGLEVWAGGRYVPVATDPAPWRDPAGAAARARVYAVHVRTAAAAQAMAPTWHADGAQLRRSVNAAGFDPQSRQLRAALAAQLRADRAAARMAAEVSRVAAAADAAHLPAADLRARAANIRAGVLQGMQWTGAVQDAAAALSLARAGVYDAAADALEAAAPATPYRAIQDPAPAGQDPAADTLAADVAEWLAKSWPHLADDPRPRAGLILAAKAERQRAARVLGRYAEIARACADTLQARADALPLPPAATREHAPFDGFGGAWQEIRNGRAEPDEYRAHVVEAMQAAKAAGLFYNADTYPRAAAIMAARWGYPDARELPDLDDDGVPRWFGSHCYMANDAARASEAREAAREAREGLRLAVGVKLGALIFNDYKLTRGAEVAEVLDDGDRVTIKGNRGAAAVRIQCAPLAVRGAIERAHEKGKRRDSFAEFCVGRPAPVAAAIVAPVADPEPASLADRILAELASRAPGDILTARGLAVYCGDRNPTPEELQPWADACAELAAVGRLVLFDYSAQGQPAGYALPYVAPASAAAPAAEPAASVADTVAQCYGPEIDAASLADLQAANETAATLAGAIDAAAAGADAVHLLRAEAARVRLAAAGQPVRVAARYLVASAMLAELAAVRAETLAPVVSAPADYREARGMRMQRDAMAAQLRDGAMTLPGRVLVMLRGKVEWLSEALASVPADWSATNAELCATAGQHLQPARIPRQPGQGPAHARPQSGSMPAAAGARRAATMAEPAGPTCYPWRAARTAGQLARPPPGR